MTQPEASKPESAAVEPWGYLIYKGGRGWYRRNAEGYTPNPAEAGRFSLADAVRYSHPNGPDGPRDGITFQREDFVPGAIPAAVEPVAWQVNYEYGRKIVLTEPDPKDWDAVVPLIPATALTALTERT